MFRTLAPANNGSIVTYNQEEVLVVASSATALTWLLPAVSGLLTGTTIHVTNTLAGTITVKDPTNTTTLGTVVAGSLGTFKLAGNATWINARSDLAAEFATVTQSTSISTGVTINSTSGAITPQSSTIAPGESVAFIVTNNKAISNYNVLINLANYTGTGSPVLTATRLTSGSFVILIQNIHPTLDVEIDDTTSIRFRIV
jgi:VCBS repeat-containing protein